MTLDISFLVCFSWLCISSSGKSPSKRCRDIWVPVAPSGNLTKKATSRVADRSPRIRTFTLLNFPEGTLFNRVNFRYTTAVFTLPASRQVSLNPGLCYSAHSFALRLPSDTTSQYRPLESPKPSRRRLPSASTFATIIK
jgi:hypothetical protein